MIRNRGEHVGTFTSGSGAGSRSQTIEVWDRHTFDPEHLTVRVAGVPVIITSKEFALALLLFRNIDHAVARSQIVEAVWGDRASATSRTLDQHIYKIRNRLQLKPENGLLLSSVYRFGFRLERISASQSPTRASAA